MLLSGVGVWGEMCENVWEGGRGLQVIKDGKVLLSDVWKCVMKNAAYTQCTPIPPFPSPQCMMDPFLAPVPPGAIPTPSPPLLFFPGGADGTVWQWDVSDDPPFLSSSGGADGTVLQWDVSDGSVAESRFAGEAIQLNSPFGPGDKTLPAVRSGGGWGGRHGPGGGG